MKKLGLLLSFYVLLFQESKACLCAPRFSEREFSLEEYDTNNLIALVEIESSEQVTEFKKIMPNFALKFPYSFYPNAGWPLFEGQFNLYFVKPIKTFKGNTDSLKFISQPTLSSCDGRPLNIGGKYLIYSSSKESRSPMIINYSACYPFYNTEFNFKDDINSSYLQALGEHSIGLKTGLEKLRVVSILDTIQNGEISVNFINSRDSTRAYLNFEGNYKNGKRNGVWKINSSHYNYKWRQTYPSYISKYEKGLYKKGNKIGVWLVSEWDNEEKKWVRREEDYGL